MECRCRKGRRQNGERAVAQFLPRSLQRKVYEARQQLIHHGHPVTAENIKTVFHGQEIQTHKYMLMEVLKKHNDQMAELVGLEYAPGTLERFQTAYRHTLSFLQWKYKVEMNAYLKEIADVCRIQKKLTYHIARHTFATTVTLTNGVPIETVSKMLGHRNLRTTQHYAKILDKKIGEDMKGLREKFR